MQGPWVSSVRLARALAILGENNAMSSTPQVATSSNPSLTQTPLGTAAQVRLLEEPDLTEADRVLRLAFGTFLGLPDPSTFLGDAEFIRSRWQVNPRASLGATLRTKMSSDEGGKLKS